MLPRGLPQELPQSDCILQLDERLLAIPTSKMSITQILPDDAKSPGHLKGRSGCLDRLALLGTAVVVIVIFGGAYWLTLVTGKSPLWVFGAGNAIGIAFILLRRFKTMLKLPYFKLYLAAWAVMHGGRRSSEQTALQFWSLANFLSHRTYGRLCDYSALIPNRTESTTASTTATGQSLVKTCA